MKRKEWIVVSAFLLVLAGLFCWEWFQQANSEVIGIAPANSRANTPITDLPADATYHNTDIFYDVDQGGRSKQMAGSVISGMVSDTADDLRDMIGDSTSYLYGLIGGGGAFTVSGDKIYATSSDDSLGLGTSVPTQKLDVNGNANITGSLYGYKFQGDTLEFETGTNDNNTITMYNRYTMRFGTYYYGNTSYLHLNLFNKTFSLFESGADQSTLQFTNNAIYFGVGGSTYRYDGTYFRNSSDSLATRAFARANGSGSSDSTWTEATITDTLHTEVLEVEDSIYVRGYTFPSTYSYAYADSALEVMKFDSSVVTSGKGLVVPPESTSALLDDLQDGEIKWGYVDENDSVQYEYSIGRRELLSKTLGKLIFMDEQNLQRIRALEQTLPTDVEERLQALEKADKSKQSQLLILYILLAALIFYIVIDKIVVNHIVTERK